MTEERPEEDGGAAGVLGPMRLPFLILAPACVAMGIGTATWTTGAVRPLHVVLVLIGGVAVHVSVNALNEYFDFRSGLDFRTDPTPFSGGSGTLPERPEMAPTALTTGLAALGIAALIGLYFLRLRGVGLLPVTLGGALLVVTYTPFLVRNALACLLAPGLGFGVFMVMATDYVLTGTYTWTAFVASLVPTFLVSDLLLLNQFPDVEADRSVGRSHLPILLGRRASSLVYAAFLLGAYASLAFGVARDLLPAFALLGFLTLPVAVLAAVGAFRHAEDVERLLRPMGMNVVVNVATPALIAVGLFLG